MNNPTDTLELFARTGDGVRAVDPSRRIVLWNQVAEELLGYRADEALGPLGAVLVVLTPRGEAAGCTTVRHEGRYGFLHVYRKDKSEPPLPGFREGEPLAFRVNEVPRRRRRRWPGPMI